MTLPFTVKELVDIYMMLPNADAREAFWKELSEKINTFDDDQKSLFVNSWSESLRESLEHAQATIDEVEAARNAEL